VIPEAPPQETDAGLVPARTGWFVMNTRDARRTATSRTAGSRRRSRRATARAGSPV